MKEVKIYGKSIFKILAIINKLQLKNYLGEIYVRYTNLEKKNRIAKVKLLKELDRNGLENNTDNIAIILEENKTLAQELGEIEKENASITQDILFTILEKIVYAEKEIYELLADVYGKNIKEISEETDLLDLAEMVEGIIKNNDFKKVFTKLFK